MSPPASRLESGLCLPRVSGHLYSWQTDHERACAPVCPQLRGTLEDREGFGCSLGAPIHMLQLLSWGLVPSAVTSHTSDGVCSVCSRVFRYAKKRRRALGVWLCHCLTYSLETGSFTEFAASHFSAGSVSKPSTPPGSGPYSTRVAGVCGHTWLFTWSLPP